MKKQKKLMLNQLKVKSFLPHQNSIKAGGASILCLTQPFEVCIGPTGPTCPECANTTPEVGCEFPF